MRAENTMQPKKHPAAVSLGRRGGLAGRGPSKARDPLKMAEAGRKGALARWGKRKKKINRHDHPARSSCGNSIRVRPTD